MQPTLSRELVSTPEFQARRDLVVPTPALLDLPEKAVQFGTGALLRGFVDYFLDVANRDGRFGGRVVMVGSTGSGRDQAVNDQDGLFTLAIQGVDNGEVFRENRVIASVSRAVSSRDAWDAVLECARNPELQLIFSNTTEVGIVLDEEDSADLSPPRSFPGKLARFLFERARTFDFDAAKGVVVLPCELIENNGDRLREIVLQLAERWKLGPAFVRWVEEGVPFCNTLVDRIVPGTPDEERLERLQQELGYQDGMLTTCEVYRLFAIQGDDALRARLGFAESDPGVIVAGDVGPYRERKVRLLNGTHTIMVPAALLCGHEVVNEAIKDDLIGRFVRRVMLDEIVPSLEAEGAEQFARDVLDRFANPFIRHALLDITLQSTMKMRVRIVPTILAYTQKKGSPPPSVALGLAAFLLFMRGDVQDKARQDGLRVPQDDQAEYFRSLWASLPDEEEVSLRHLVYAVLSEQSLWHVDLNGVPGLTAAVGDHLVRMRREGVPAALEAHLAAG